MNLLVKNLFARRILAFIGSAVLVIWLSTGKMIGQESVNTADHVFYNAKVYTVNEQKPWAEAVVIDDSKIVYVGDDEGAQSYIGDETTAIDLAGKMVLPGFVSGHDHLIASRWMNYGVDLYSAQSKQEYLNLIDEYAKANPDEKVIRGIGWNPEIYGFAWLPAFIKSGAWQPETIIPSSQQELHQAAVEAGITAYLNPALVTPNLNDVEGSLEDFKFVMDYMSELENDGKLKLRTFVMPIVKNPSLDPEKFADTAAGFAEQYNSDLLRVFGIKIHPEGNWSSRTSLMLEPYLPQNEAELLERPSPTAYGAASVDGALMKEVVLAANARGLDVSTHVDGSATVRNMIDAIEAAREQGYTDARNSLHHLFWTHPDDLQRIFDMDIPVNVSPNFTTDWSGQKLLALNLLGEERVQQQLTMGASSGWGRAKKRRSLTMKYSR